MKIVIDTGFGGLRAAEKLVQVAGDAVLAATAAPDCFNYGEEVDALCTVLTGLPVYRGASRPTLRDVLPAKNAPGSCHAPLPAQGHAVSAIIDLARQNPGLTMVCLGPLTNLALAIMKEPALPSLLGRVVVAGGAQLGYGHVTETAEYNIYCDPEAADTVFKCGLPVVMVPAEAAEDYFEAAAALVLDEKVATNLYSAFVDVDVTASRTYGQTVVDPIGWNPITDERHGGEKAQVVAAVDPARIKALLGA